MIWTILLAAVIVLLIVGCIASAMYWLSSDETFGLIFGMQAIQAIGPLMELLAKVLSGQ